MVFRSWNSNDKVAEMSDVEMTEALVAAESKETLLAKEWIRLTENSDDGATVFKNLFFHHLSKHVFSCFETSQAQILKANIKEDKCQEKIFNVLEYFLCGEDPARGFGKLQSQNKPPQLCGKMFKYGDPTFSCRDCGYDGTCVLCIDCFHKSIHKEHQYKMNTSCGSGFCDCGDPEAWKQGHCCEIHQQRSDMEDNEEENPIDKLPPDLVNRAGLLFETALQHAVEMVCWDKTGQLPETLSVSCNEDSFVTMLFNDEVHTYEEVISTLREAVPGCDREKALAYANTVDREGCSPVRVGNYITCEAARKIIEKGTSGPARNPLKCKVMHHKVVAHQLFVLQLLGWINKITSYSEGLRRLLCEIVVEPLGEGSLLDRVFQEDANLWKVARMHTHKVFMNSMIMDPEGKKLFAIHFTKNYKKLMDEFVADDHDHAVSATSFSVQIFTVPTLARMLVLDHDVLIVILKTFMEELKQRLADESTYVLHNPWFQPIRRAQYVLFDLKYILQHKPDPWTDELRVKFLNFLDLFLTLLKNMQGMDMVTRKTGQHIETDPEWESAFTLQMRLMPILTMVCEWCLSDAMVFKNAVDRTSKTLIAAGKKFGVMQLREIKVASEKFRVIKHDVSKSPVSIHLPVSRFLAALLVGCHKYNSEIITLFPNDCKTYDNKLFLMEHSLRALVMVAQVHAGMWRRNGYAIINQVFHYQNVKCRTEMYDRDVTMMQTAAAYLDPDLFMAILLDKFSVLDWSLQTFDESKIDGDKMTAKLTLAEEFLALIIAVIGERYTPGIGQVTSDDFFRREIIHKLCIRPLAHSELVKALPLPDFVVENEHSVDHIMEAVATFKKPGVTGRGLYELKEECYKEYNPFFYHYSRIEQSKAEEQHRKRAKKDKSLDGCPPPVPPEFCSPFKKILHLLSSKVLISVMSTVLYRAGNGNSKAVNHMHIQQTLHLIALALLEVKRHRELGQSDEFKFIKAATKNYNESQETLLKLLEGLHDNAHVLEFAPLIEWLLKSFHDELAAIEQRESNQELQEKLSKSDTSSALEDEKARKARLAQERRAKIMAQMSALQKAFIRENADLLASMETDRSMDDHPTDTDSGRSVHLPVALGRHHGERDPKVIFPLEPCILCQEQQEVSTEGRAVVMAAFVQHSTVLSKSRGKMFENGENFDPLYPPADTYWGLHTSSCGHIMHSDCWQGFFDSVVAKERRALRLRQFISVDVNRREFLCPLCGCICNTVLPILPPLALGKHDSELEEVTLQEYFSSMQDVVMSNLSVLTANQEQESKKEQSSVPPSLAERFQALFHALTRTGSKFSTKLKDMMKVFAQTCFTIGLGLEPNEEDKRVPVMVWTACAYTIESGESAMRAEEKPLFSGFTTRQSQCIGALTRLAAVAAGISNSNTIKLHCLRLLATLTPDVIPDVESPPLTDLDIFSLMVKLRLSMPSLQYKESTNGKPTSQATSAQGVTTTPVIGLESSSSMDICSFQLCLAAQLVKILLTASPELDSVDVAPDEVNDQEEQEAIKMASLWGKLRQWAGLQSSAPHASPSKLLNHVQSMMLPFLRCSGLFFHFLTEIPGPDSLKEPCTRDEEWEALCHYLSVPNCLTDLLQWDQDSNSIYSFVITLAAKRWCSHEVVKKTLATAGVENLGYSIAPNHLLPLPRDYSELINKASLFTCPNSEGDESRAPVLCLICGEMLCSQSYCCQTEVGGDKVGACAAHAQYCGAGVGVFLRVRECQILLMASRSKGSFYNAPYLDTYGETDQGLRRGNPLYLCPQRYNKLQKLWWSHGIAEEVAHSLESNRNLLSIDWTIL